VFDDRDDRFAKQRERLHRLSEEIEVVRKHIAENAGLISGFRSRWAREKLLLLLTDQAYGTFRPMMAGVDEPSRE
jgi:hypothetical protein